MFSSFFKSSHMRLVVFMFAINAILLSWAQIFTDKNLEYIIFFFASISVGGKIGQKALETKKENL